MAETLSFRFMDDLKRSAPGSSARPSSALTLQKLRKSLRGLRGPSRDGALAKTKSLLIPQKALNKESGKTVLLFEPLLRTHHKLGRR